MGRAENSSEQKLVIKHTFLEFVGEQENCSGNSPVIMARQRSWTEPTIAEDECYDEQNSRLGPIETPYIFDETAAVLTTPDPSPLFHPAYQQMPSFAPGDSWDGMEGMPAAWACPHGGWWPHIPFDAGTNMGGANCQDGVDRNQLTTSELPSIPEVSTPRGADQRLPSIAEVPTQESVVNNVVAKETRTTVMMRGLPEMFTRTSVLRVLQAQGFFGRLNFLYVPMDFKRHKNLGYALINLVSPAEALRLGKHFEGFSSWEGGGGSPCTVAWCSPQQGLQEHVDRYKNSPVMHESVPEEWRPMLLAHGVSLDFPAPTITIKAPRLKGVQ